MNTLAEQSQALWLGVAGGVSFAFIWHALGWATGLLRESWQGRNFRAR